VADGPGVGNQLDTDGLVENADLGPKPDSIGDACDDSDNDGKEDGSSTGVAGSGNCTDGIDNECTDAIDNDGDTRVNDGCPAKDTAEDPACANAIDDDPLDDAPTPTVNDGCPAKGTAESICSGASDNDGDTVVNDGCPIVGLLAEKPDCLDAIDNDGDTVVNDGCPAKGTSEYDLPDMLDPQCLVWTDKGEITAGGRTQAQIFGTNPGTGLYFHAMPWAAVCIADTDTDLDGYCNTLEWMLGSNPNNVNSKPESLVIDASLSGVGANVKPAARVPQSCTDGVDNDADTEIDGADNSALGCDPTVLSYAGDGDRDGVPDASDNCGSLCQVPNPEQTDRDTDGIGDACDPDMVDMTAVSDADSFVDRCDNCPTLTSEDQSDFDFDRLGDVCDPDDDNDGFTDTIELYLPTDPLDRCPDNTSDDAWPLDNDMSRDVTVTGDVFAYVGQVGCSVVITPSCKRLDLDVTGDITVTGDVFSYVGKIGNACN